MEQELSQKLLTKSERGRGRPPLASRTFFGKCLKRSELYHIKVNIHEAIYHSQTTIV